MIQTSKRGKLIERIAVGLSLAVIIGVTAGGVYSMSTDEPPRSIQEVR